MIWDNIDESEGQLWNLEFLKYGILCFVTFGHINATCCVQVNPYGMFGRLGTFKFFQNNQETTKQSF